MRLNRKEYSQYLKIHPLLIYYIGKRKKMLPEADSFEDFMNYSLKDKYPIRNAMYKNIILLDDYITENKKQLTQEDIEIIQGFKDFRKETFYVMKLTKKHAFFLGKKYIYAVHALGNPFEEVLGNTLPTMIEAVLLPFKGKIIYDGFVSNYPIHFGQGIKKTIKNNYNLVESKYGIITELPEKVEKIALKDRLERELKAMMKTQSSRDYNYYEIEELLEKHPQLESVHIMEWGRINTRAKKKALKNLGIKKRWFAIYNDTIISSDSSEKELKKKVQEMILDLKKRKSVFYFKV